MICLALFSILLDFWGNYAFASTSDLLRIQIREIQQLVEQERKKAEEQSVSNENPASVTVTQTPDGHKTVLIQANITFNIGIDVSGEAIKTYLQRIVELSNLKNVFDLCREYLNIAMETEMSTLLICSLIWKSTRLRV